MTGNEARLRNAVRDTADSLRAVLRDDPQQGSVAVQWGKRSITTRTTAGWVRRYGRSPDPGQIVLEDGDLLIGVGCEAMVRLAYACMHPSLNKPTDAFLVAWEGLFRNRLGAETEVADPDSRDWRTANSAITLADFLLNTPDTILSTVQSRGIRTVADMPGDWADAFDRVIDRHGLIGPPRQMGAAVGAATLLHAAWVWAASQILARAVLRHRGYIDRKELDHVS